MIKKLFYEDTQGGHWKIGPGEFGKINLLVGESGSGKTRILNVIHNISTSITGVDKQFRAGHWNMEITTKNYEFNWKYIGEREGKTGVVVTEELSASPKNGKGEREVLISRTRDRFTWKKIDLPRLEPDKTSITLLKAEDPISELHKFFANIYRRSFQGDALAHFTSLAATDLNFDEYKLEKGRDALCNANFPINMRMHILYHAQRDIYEAATEIFRSIFPKIIGFSLEFLDPSAIGIFLQNEGGTRPARVPVLMLSEAGVHEKFPFMEMSSGMQKVLALITDILLLPENSLYLIDEYENSLGINAIDFLPDFLADFGGSNQFLITTHHPYLINNMPINTWRVSKRNGSTVTIVDGGSLRAKYGKSKQNFFTQLVNDPLYSDK